MVHQRQRKMLWNLLMCTCVFKVWQFTKGSRARAQQHSRPFATVVRPLGITQAPHEVDDLISRPRSCLLLDSQVNFMYHMTNDAYACGYLAARPSGGEGGGGDHCLHPFHTAIMLHGMTATFKHGRLLTQETSRFSCPHACSVPIAF